MEKNVKLVDFFSTSESMNSKQLLEERLQRAAYSGDLNAVQELLNLGVDVNARPRHNNGLRGWTPLHWACRKGYLDVAALLLKNGADKNLRSEAGETPVSLCTNLQILQLLDCSMDPQQILNDSTAHSVIHTMPKYLKNDPMHGNVDSGIPRVRSSGLYKDELVLKIREADTPDPDFIEIELPQSDLTYQALIHLCGQELNIDPNEIIKLRKLPNTRLRKDKDIQRLQNFQEIEVITNAVNPYKYAQNANGVPSNIPVLPANGYQSISKKDQTILY